MNQYRIVTIDSRNIDEHGIFCVRNRHHSGYVAKRGWLDARFDEGMKIKLILLPDGRQAGFLEYIPGEYTWRVVDAPGYLVIHCLWVRSTGYPSTGMAAGLLNESFDDAIASGREGIAVVTSDGPWMAGKEIFFKNGFSQVDQTAPHYQLLVRRPGNGPLPSFPRDWSARLNELRGLHLLVANQCPFIGKAVNELPPVAEEHGIRLRLVELKNAADIRRRMPSPFGVIALVHDGRLLADHPISATRFRNILRRDLKLETGTQGRQDEKHHQKQLPMREK